MATDTNAMGALRSKINLSLHTYHATKAWWGRTAEAGKPPIIGMRQFLFLTGAVQRNVTRDDPYADYWMLLIDDKLADVRAKLDAAMADAKAILAQIPPELEIEENVNQQPFTTPVYTGGQQGWLALRLLIDFDRLVREILLASHVALMTRRDAHRFLDAINHEIRSLCAFPARYPGYSGVTRDDFAANNAKAREAREKFGELPEDVLKGTRRSPYAPEIHKPQSSAPEPAPTAKPSADQEKPSAEPDQKETDAKPTETDTAEAKAAAKQ